MRFSVVTLFPEMIEHAVAFGVVGQALKEGLLSVEALSPRVFTTNVHQTVDDRPFGGGDGMVMLSEPLKKSLEHLLLNSKDGARRKVIHLSPRGRPLNDAMARELAKLDELVLVASRYGGVDQRFLNECVDEEVSVGDYVLSGGELPALALIDAVSRLLPGVLGNEASPDEESFAKGLLEQPQYTRPRDWEGFEVPEELLSGDHAKIAAWKRMVSLIVTADRRPELLRGLASEAQFPASGASDLMALAKDVAQAMNYLSQASPEKLELLGIASPAGALEALINLKSSLPEPLKKGGRR